MAKVAGTGRNHFRGANLSQCGLRGTVLRGALLDGARLDDARTGALPETGIATVFPDGFVLERQSL